VSKPPLVLHVFPSFDVGGAQVRTAALMNLLGGRFRHAVVSLNGGMGCAARVGPGVELTPLPFPTLPGERLPARLLRVRRAIREAAPDALVTSNWGSIEWAMANLAPPRVRHLHMEDGFGPDEAAGQLPRRVWTRRAVLRFSDVLLPSRNLERIAREAWRLPAPRLRFVPNGLDLARFNPDGPRAELGLAGEGPVIGTVAALRPEKNLGRLLRAGAALARDGAAFRLAVVGDGPERAGLERLVAELGLAGRARFLGHVADPAAAYRAMDLVALSSDTEQMPFSVLEGMATGLCVVATEVGDIRSMLAPENHGFLAPKNDDALAQALRGALASEEARRRAGAANRAKAERDYDERRMAERHAALWLGAG
jgi:glycosyltransferase involved in cell wall biosynthesis